MKSIKGSKTEQNLLLSFAGESQARNRYTFFASQAKKEGFIQISQIFEETANQEKEHAKRFFKFLEGGELEITGKFPAGVVGTTAENLKEAAAGEKHEWMTMYPDFATVARDEGFDEIGAVFAAVCMAEKQHERRYKDLLKNITEGLVFKKKEEVVWRCTNCGFVTHPFANAPEKCPACAHPKDYFEVLGENW